MPRDTRAYTSEIGLPPVSAWVRNLVIGLFALFVVEVLVSNVWGGLYATLAWSVHGPIRPWQPFTRYLVQGSASVINVVFALLAMYFILPTLDNALGRRALSHAAAAALAGGTLVGFLSSIVGYSDGFLLGWSGILTAVFALFGLAVPDATVRLYFFIPVQARFFTWGSGIIAALLLLGTRSSIAADALGCWLGAMAWWYTLGPGGKTRQRRNAGKKLERDLSKFTVLQGGGGNRDDLVN